jgi:hypothetical protein
VTVVAEPKVVASAVAVGPRPQLHLDWELLQQVSPVAVQVEKGQRGAYRNTILLDIQIRMIR